MEQMNFCQSCGMPLNDPSVFGTNKNDGPNEEYCVYCYKDGDFLHDCNMDEMIEHCAQLLDEFNKDSEKKLTREQAVAGMKKWFPTLKRWKQ